VCAGNLIDRSIDHAPGEPYTEFDALEEEALAAASRQI
jgi:hypothetical protein